MSHQYVQRTTSLAPSPSIAPAPVALPPAPIEAAQDLTSHSRSAGESAAESQEHEKAERPEQPAAPRGHSISRISILPAAPADGGPGLSRKTILPTPIMRPAVGARPVVQRDPFGTPSINKLFINPDDKKANDKKAAGNSVVEAVKHAMLPADQQRAANPELKDANSVAGLAAVDQINNNRKVRDQDKKTQEEKDKEEAALAAALKKSGQKPDSAGESKALAAIEKLGAAADTGSSVLNAPDALAETRDDVGNAAAQGKALAQSITGRGAKAAEETPEVDEEENQSGFLPEVKQMLGRIQLFSGLVDGLKKTMEDAKNIKSGDDIEQNQSKIAMVDNVKDIGDKLGEVGTVGAELGARFGGNSGVAAAAGYLPILGIIVHASDIARTGFDLVAESMRSRSALSQYAAASESKSKNKELYMASLSHLRSRNLQLVTGEVFSIVVSSLKLVGSLVPPPVGLMLSGAATVLGTVSDIAHSLYDSYKAGKVHANRNQFAGSEDEAKKLGDEHADQKAGAAMYLLGHDPIEVATFLINKGRKFAQAERNEEGKPMGVDKATGKAKVKNYAGAQIAMKSLEAYGITEAMLKNSSLSVTRLAEMMLTKLKEEDDDLKTVGDKLLDVKSKVENGFEEGSKKAKGMLSVDPKYIELLRVVKNARAYKGKTDRDEKWDGEQTKILTANIAAEIRSFSYTMKIGQQEEVRANASREALALWYKLMPELKPAGK
jgi:hypothetical protein